jgi:serine/threonine-protein kinase RsbW
MEADPPTWSMTLPSDVRLLTTVRSFVEAVCQIGCLDEETTSAIVLATHEAAQNIIRHAHGNDPRNHLQIQCVLHTDRMEVRLLDEGEPFDLEAVPSLDPAELRVGGRGIFLMRALMDEVSCQPRGERGNSLRMIKRWAARPPTRDAG